MNEKLIAKLEGISVTYEQGDAGITITTDTLEAFHYAKKRLGKAYYVTPEMRVYQNWGTRITLFAPKGVLACD